TVQTRQTAAGEDDFALIGQVEPAKQVEQRALAGAGRAAQSQNFAASHREMDAEEHPELAPADGVRLEQLARFDEWRRRPRGGWLTHGAELPQGEDGRRSTRAPIQPTRR